jgi:hypothetical protein
VQAVPFRVIKIVTLVHDDEVDLGIIGQVWVME